MAITMSSVSVAHEGQADKPNEDRYYAASVSPNVSLAVIADGVTRAVGKNRIYPAELGVIAPQCLVDAVRSSFASGGRLENPKFVELREAFQAANKLILRENNRHGISAKCDYVETDYLATTVVAVLVGPRSAAFAYIGDSIILHLPVSWEPTLLSRDQLFAYHNVARQRKLDHRERALWGRGVLRNHSNVPGDLGYGVLTGEPGALDFIEGGEVEVEAGDRFILASDALRVCSETPSNEQEYSSSYAKLLSEVGSLPGPQCAAAIVSSIRTAEKERSVRSDDATVIVVDIT